MSAEPDNFIEKLPEIKEREPEGNKGTFGKVLLVAGSQGMSGAAILSGSGALRGGAGLVYLAVPSVIQNIVATAEASYLTIALHSDQAGRIEISGIDELPKIYQSVSAVAIGPGLGISDSLKNLVKQIYESATTPVVFDADALNLLSRLEQLPDDPPGPRILTPHPGEFSRLTNLSIDEIQANRKEHALKYAKENGVVLLLKGAETIITDGKNLALNQTGNPGLATGGTGDVLTGLITALIGQGYSPFESAQLGAFLHGLAGDLAAEDLSQQGMIASDLPNYLPQAWKKLIESA